MTDKAATPAPPELSQKQALLRMLPLILLTTWLCHSRPGNDPQQKLQTCGTHLHQIGVALERSRLGSEEKLYPKELKEAFSEAKKMPACPAGGVESYEKGYRLSPGRQSYLLVCSGDHHGDAGVPSDYPRIAFGPVEDAPTREESSTQGSSGALSPSPIPEAEATPALSASPQSLSPTPGTGPTHP